MITVHEYAARRQQLAKQIVPNSVVILSSAKQHLRNGDIEFPFRQDSNFYYLTGFNEPEAIAVLIKDDTTMRYLLFNRNVDPKQAIWTGQRAGQTGAKRYYGVDDAYPIEEFLSQLPKLMINCTTLYMSFDPHKFWHKKIHTLLYQQACLTRKSGKITPHHVVNLDPLLAEMRLFKSDAEIVLMRQAAAISVEAHEAVMRLCRPGQYEYELQATLTQIFMKYGSRDYAYYPIIAAGNNSCILHYQENNRKINAGDIVLVDAGAEIANYGADITRTFPADRKFTGEQRAIYEIVLQTQLAIIDAIKPNLSFDTMQVIAIKTLTQGLIDIGVLKGTLSTLIANKAYLPFYMHGAGHWLGLDTHDVGCYKINNQWRSLVPRMALTVEPGIYIAIDTPNVDKRWWGIGVRIEDDVIVTQDGNEVLSHALVKSVTDIEALRAEKFL